MMVFSLEPGYINERLWYDTIVTSAQREATGRGLWMGK